MGSRNMLTNNSNETDLTKLFTGGDNIFRIPYFQRPYKWKTQRVEQLHKDILSLIDGTDYHFLGAVIVHGKPSGPSEPSIYDVIDGQQRITTIYLLLAAIVRKLIDLGEVDEAVNLFKKYLAIGSNTGSLSNIRLHSCKDDRKQLNKVIHDLTRTEKFKDQLGSFSPKPLPETGKDSGVVTRNYKYIKKFLTTQVEQGGLERVRAIYSAVLQKMSVVEIDVWDPTNGPKIFNSLNSRQEPMTTGDLIRNEIFSRVAAEDPGVIEAVDVYSWQPFYQKFDFEKTSHFEEYFFPYGLIKNPNLKKSEVFSHLRKKWEEIKDPEKIIASLATYQDAFLDIRRGLNTQGLSKNLSLQVRQLHDLRAPSSCFPFVMQVTKSVVDNELNESHAINILKLLESFFVRRAIVGIEPTGLHAVFKRLWVDCDGEITPERVEKEIRDHRTVKVPSDSSLSSAVKTRDLYNSSITKYILACYDKSLDGDIPLDIPWIEHVYPQTPKKGWEGVFTGDEAKELTHTLANLLPLSKEMNIKVSNGPYIEKRAEFSDSSMYKSARYFASQYNDWTPILLKERANVLAEWALKRWPL